MPPIPNQPVPWRHRSVYPIYGIAFSRPLDAPPAKNHFPQPDPFGPASTADVVLLGARLAKLVELIHDHSLGSVTPLDARYSNALGPQRPWVARIVVSRIDKGGAAAG